MIELEDWQDRPSTPPAYAMLKELLNGSGPPVYRIGGKLYVNEDEADRWLAGKRARLDPSEAEPGRKPSDDEQRRALNEQYAAGVRELLNEPTN